MVIPSDGTGVVKTVSLIGGRNEFARETGTA